MGDNIYLGDRNGVRTPMQWTPDRNGGFSRGDPAKLYLPPIMDPVYGYQAVNVEAQSRSLSSLLNWMKRMIAVRKTSRVFGRGTLAFIRPANRAVLVYLRQYGDEVILCVANLSRSRAGGRARPVGLARPGAGRDAGPGALPSASATRRSSSRWRRTGSSGSSSSTTTGGDRRSHGRSARMGHAGVSATAGSSLTEGRSRQLLERDVLPHFLAARRWFAEKGSRRPADVASPRRIPLAAGEQSCALAIVECRPARGVSRYAAAARRRAGAGSTACPTCRRTSVLALVRRGAREGVLVDAIADRDFVAWLLRAMHARARRSTATRGRLEFRATDALRARAPVADRRRSRAMQRRAVELLGRSSTHAPC